LEDCVDEVMEFNEKIFKCFKCHNIERNSKTLLFYKIENQRTIENRQKKREKT
jgi:hypothetical protein